MLEFMHGLGSLCNIRNVKRIYEWSVETMHWLLDVYFGEDGCRIQTKTNQQNLNMVRKLSLNIMRNFKQKSASKAPLTTLMFKSLMNPNRILAVLSKN